MKKTIAAAFLAVAVVAGGCGAIVEPGDSDAGSSAPVDPKDVLLAAVPDEATEPFRFTTTDPELPVSGVVDAANRGVEMDFGYADPDLGFVMDMSILVIDQDTWAKIIFSQTEGLAGLPELPEKWLEIDRTRLEDPDVQGMVYDGADVSNTNILIWAIVDVEETEPGKYRGTLDLNQTMDAEIVSAEMVAALGDEASAVPFTAEIDDSDRLVAMTVEVPETDSSPAYDYEVRYFDYGIPEGVTVPEDAVEAPPAAYELLNG